MALSLGFFDWLFDRTGDNIVARLGPALAPRLSRVDASLDRIEADCAYLKQHQAAIEQNLAAALLQLSRIHTILMPIQTQITQLNQQEAHNMQQLDDLTAEVSRNTTVVGSALVLIQGFAAALEAAGTDPAKLQALRDSLAANDDALAAAVAANTPAQS